MCDIIVGRGNRPRPCKRPPRWHVWADEAGGGLNVCTHHVGKFRGKAIVKIGDNHLPGQGWLSFGQDDTIQLSKTVDEGKHDAT